MKPWPFLYSVHPDGGLVKNDGFVKEAAAAGSLLPPPTLRGDLYARGIRSSSPLPKRVTAKARE